MDANIADTVWRNPRLPGPDSLTLPAMNRQARRDGLRHTGFFSVKQAIYSADYARSELAGICGRFRIGIQHRFATAPEIVAPDRRFSTSCVFTAPRRSITT